ncbi:MAG: hypothetical protein ACNA77_05640 [Opitutales bacterium]
MDIPGKITALYLAAMCLALALLIAALANLLRPPHAGLEPLPGSPPLLKDNWFSPRTFDLLGGEAAPSEGIDAGQNPFTRPIWASEAVVPEPPVVVPEPEPEPEPPAPPPATREITIVYRGFYRSSSGQPFVYLELDGATRVYAINQTVAPGWTVGEVDASQLTLRQGEERQREFPFNRKKSLEVPLQPQP